jgi:hypothetical protein
MMKRTCLDCALDARWLPLMLFYADRRRFPNAGPARSVCGIPCCDEHRKKWTLAELLTDEGYEKIAAAFALMGKAQPKRSDTELTFIRIESDEAQSFLRASQTH